MKERYQPGEEELQRAQEHLESAGISEQKIEHGMVQKDATGRIILRTEAYQATQATQIEYGDGRSSTEHGKIIEGKKAGQEYRREHPLTEQLVELHWNDPEIGPMNVRAPAVLETVGETTVGAPTGTNEPWAHFEISDPETLEAFANIPRQERASYAVLNGDFGGGFDVRVGRLTIHIASIGRISVDFGEDGLPVKATLHKIIWTEVPSSETKEQRP